MDVLFYVIIIVLVVLKLMFWSFYFYARNRRQQQLLVQHAAQQEAESTRYEEEPAMIQPAYMLAGQSGPLTQFPPNALPEYSLEDPINKDMAPPPYIPQTDLLTDDRAVLVQNEELE